MYISCYIEEIWITFLTVFFLDFSSVPDSAQFNSMLSKTELSVEIKSADYLIIFVPNYQFLKINT